MRSTVAALLVIAVSMIVTPRASAAKPPTCFGHPATQWIDATHPGPLVGTAGDDVLVGSAGSDYIDTRFSGVQGGVDFICGLGGSDNILITGAGSKADAGTGADDLSVYDGAWGTAGSGNDLVDAVGAGAYGDGGSGNDRIQVFDGATGAGGSGNDSLSVESGTGNTLLGGSGEDFLNDAGAANATMDCGSGYDSFKRTGPSTIISHCELDITV